MTRDRSPGTASSVGCVKDLEIRFAVLRWPRIRSPNRCSMTPPPSMFDRRAMLSPYPLLSVKGSVKCFETSSAKFVFSVWREGSS